MLSKGDFYSILDDSRYPGEFFLWDGENGWINNVQRCFRTENGEDLGNELIRMSAMNIEGQPVIVSQVPEEILEGENKGMWVLRVEVRYLKRNPEYCC